MKFIDEQLNLWFDWSDVYLAGFVREPHAVLKLTPRRCVGPVIKDPGKRGVAPLNVVLKEQLSMKFFCIQLRTFKI
jgi:hypothetical protein